MAIKKIVLDKKICRQLPIIFTAAGIGWCPNSEQFITMHGRRILLDQADEASIVQRNEIVARALTASIDLKEYLDYQAVFATMFQNISGSTIPVDNNTLTVMFPADNRTEAINRLCARLEMPEVYEKTYLEADDGGIIKTNTTVRTGGIFGRIATTHKGNGNFVTNITYNTITHEATTYPLSDGLERVESKIKSIDRVDVIMLEYSIDLDQITLVDSVDKVDETIVTSCFTIPYFGAVGETKGFYKSISSGSAYQHWIDELAVSNAVSQLKCLDPMDKVSFEKIHTPESAVTTHCSKADKYSDRVSLIATHVIDRNGSIWSRLRTHNRGLYFYQPNCKELGKWFNKIAGFEIGVTMDVNAETDRFAMKAGAFINLTSPNSYGLHTDEVKANDAKIVEIISDAVTAINTECKTNFTLLVTGGHTVSIHIPDFSQVNNVLSLVRDRVNKALEKTENEDRISVLEITNQSIASFANNYDENFSFLEDHTLSCLYAMRDVWRLFDIPKMPGSIGDFFRKLEATETREQAIALLTKGMEEGIFF